MSGLRDETTERLAMPLHRRYCDRACPPKSELHIADRQWMADARAIAEDVASDPDRKYRLAVVLDRTP